MYYLPNLKNISVLSNQNQQPDSSTTVSKYLYINISSSGTPLSYTLISNLVYIIRNWLSCLKFISIIYI